MPMPTRQQFCAIDPAATMAKPAASLILGSLLLLTRP